MNGIEEKLKEIADKIINDAGGTISVCSSSTINREKFDEFYCEADSHNSLEGIWEGWINDYVRFAYHKFRGRTNGSKILNLYWRVTPEMVSQDGKIECYARLLITPVNEEYFMSDDGRKHIFL